MKKKSHKNSSELIDRITALTQQLSIDPRDPRYWRSHYQPVAQSGLELAREAKTAGLGTQVVAYLTRLTTYLGLSGQFERAMEAGALASELAAAEDKSSEEYAAAIVSLAYAVGEHDNQSQAKKLLKESFRIRQKLFGRKSLPVADSLLHLGALARNAGELEDSCDYFEECLEIRQALLPGDSLEVADALDGFGLSHYYFDRYEGLELVKRAFEIRQQVLPEDHPWLAESLNNLALFYEKFGEDFDAEATYRRCLAISEKWFGPIHSEIAIHAENLGMTLQALGKLDEAEVLFRRVIEMNESMHGETAESLPLHIATFVDCLVDAGKTEEAVHWIERGLGLLRSQEENSEAKRGLLCTFGNRCSALNLESQAVEIYDELLTLLEDEPDPVLEVEVLCDLASSHEALNEPELAIQRNQQALALARTEFGQNSQRAAEVLLAMRSMYFRMDDYERELSVARDYLATAKKIYRKSPSQVAEAHHILVFTLGRCGLNDEAEEQAQTALKLYEKELGYDHVETARVMATLGQIRAIRDPIVGIEDLKHALAIQIKNYGDDPVQLFRTRYWLAETEYKAQRFDDAFQTIQLCAACHLPEPLLANFDEPHEPFDLDERQLSILKCLSAASRAFTRRATDELANQLDQLLELMA